jgi:hypothetical protein
MRTYLVTYHHPDCETATQHVLIVADCKTNALQVFAAEYHGVVVWIEIPTILRQDDYDLTPIADCDKV